MGEKNSGRMGRREVLKASALTLSGVLLSDSLEVHAKDVNTSSAPSGLRITDLRVAAIAKPGPSPCPIIRIDTNQGVFGLGVTLNEDVVRQHLAPGSGYFESTPQWDRERSWDRLWS